jgi:uncharacterized protein
VDYEWDDAKATENRRKHRVDFRDAILALEDPSRIEEFDTRFEYGEHRLRAVGMALGNLLFVVTARRKQVPDYIGAESDAK